MLIYKRKEGNIMGEWKEHKLGEIAEVQNGYAFKAVQLTSGSGIPVIKIKNIVPPYIELKDSTYYEGDIEKLAPFSIFRDDILISMTGSHINQINSAVGKVGRYKLNEAALLNQRVGKVFSKDSNILNNDFLYYYISRFEVQFELASSAGGSANQANISPAQIKNLDISLPPLSTQTAISELLSALDDKIELNNSINKNLEDLAQALFKQWFVDFEFPNENGEPYRSSGGEMVESELGMIPKGWKVSNIYEIAKIIYGAPFKSSLFNQDQKGLPLIRIRDLKSCTPQFWTDENHPKGTIIKRGEIVVGMDAEFRPHLWLGGDAWLNQRLCHFKPINGNSRLYVREIIRTQLMFFERSAVGTTVIHLGKRDIDTFNALVPNSNIRDLFKEISEPLLDKIVNNSKETESLIVTRDTLLPKLISGELTVNEAEEMIEQTDVTITY